MDKFLLGISPGEINWLYLLVLSKPVFFDTGLQFGDVFTTSRKALLFLLSASMSVC
jgi:hypothetical protein